jgi:hypothetical protein
MGIKFAEPKGGDLQFTGTVLSVAKEPGEYGEQYHCLIKPTDKEWKNIHCWLGIGETTSKDTVQKDSQLGVFLQQLVNFGLEDDDIESTMLGIKGKSFVFKKELFGKSKKENWKPIKLAPNKK